MSKEILFSIADNENESTPLFDRVERKELRAALIKYPNFRVPMPSPRKGKWEDDTAYKAYENKLVGWKQLFAHHQREVEQKAIADAKKLSSRGLSYGTGTVYSKNQKAIAI